MNISFEKTLNYYSISNNKHYLLNEYSSKNLKIPNELNFNSSDICLWNCPDCKSEYSMMVRERSKRNRKCHYCSGQKVNHTNSLRTKRPDIAELLVISSLGDNVTVGSGKNADFKCPNCQHISTKRISHVTSLGFSCPKCSDGISYPEKFMMGVLDQLKIEYQIHKLFKWSKNIVNENRRLSGSKRYDFYLPKLNVVIETHGEQHYKNSYSSVGGKTLQEEQENDRLKEKLAKENGINIYIVIDCSKSNLDYIKNNIIDSKLNSIFYLQQIDWNECHNYGCTSLVKTVCDLWMSGYTNVTEISDKLKINRSTIINYLKQGNELGLSNYDPKEEQRKAGRNTAIKVVQLNLETEFIKEFNSLIEASKTLNIESGSILRNCQGKIRTAGGFVWMYKDEYELKKDMLIPVARAGNVRGIVQLSLNGDFIKEWKSAKESSRILNISNKNISAVCKGKRKTAYGFKWMYEEDYVKLIKQN